MDVGSTADGAPGGLDRRRDEGRRGGERRPARVLQAAPAFAVGICPRDRRPPLRFAHGPPPDGFPTAACQPP
ncbi:hypothetical protein AQ741_16925 [Burkholderia pseudomallei]|nr:hypothetical protein AQ741_16925 [Burkholderia pseudomallei]